MIKNTLKKIFFDQEVLYQLIIVALWILLIFILPWKGKFFLNDDHVYEWNVRNFHTRGLNFHAYTGPSTILQTILGVVIYSIKEDPSLLRLLTSFFYVTGVIFLFKILLLEKVKPKVSLFLSLALMFNPLFLNLAFTFMSDIYFVSTLIISIYFFLLSKRKEEIKNILLSMIFLSLSFLSRQQALFLIPAYLFVDFKIYKIREIKKYFPYLIPFATIILFQLFVPKTTAYKQGSIVKTIDMLFVINTYPLILERFVKSIYYIGFFSIPVTIPYLITNFKNKNIFGYKFLISFFISSLVLFLISLLFWFTKRQTMFYIPNILTYAGFLPSSILVGIKQTVFVNSPLIVQALVTMISILSFSGLMLMVLENLNGYGKIRDISKKHVALPIFFIFSIISLVVILVFRSYYDRYLLIFIPPMLVYFSIFSKSFENHLSLGYVFLSIFIFMSVAFEQDYLSLNRTAWEVPEKNGIDKMTYRGSIEFNAYQRLDLIKDAKNIDDFKELNWLPKDEEYEYYISYIPLPNYCLIRRIDYKSFISPSFKGSLVLLEKGCSDNPVLGN